MENPRDIFIAHLRRKGLFLTRERRLILEAIFSLRKHFDFDELYDTVKKRVGRVSRATIYRTIPLLIDSGLIRDVFRGTSGTQYEQVRGLEHHDHLLCVSCGSYIEFKDERIERAQQEVCKKHGFVSVDHKLGIRGYCRKCALIKRVKA
ncbi:MAG: Fur family transcriptional regulator [Candidatus Aureabacteria bacterium]|nr:Fur family transcriptional regulator [Candidatus Auribacterota bacterium]